MIFSLDPPPCQKFPLEIFDFAHPHPLFWNLPKLYLVFNYEGFPKRNVINFMYCMSFNESHVASIM